MLWTFLLDASELQTDGIRCIMEELERIDSPERLRDLHWAALRCAGLEEFSGLL